MLWTASVFGACNLVLGIDDVSSANGPDAGQQISPSTGLPRDAGPSAADAGLPEVDASPAPGSAPIDAGPRARDAAAAPFRRDAAVDEDAGEDSDDAGLPR